MKTIKVLRKYGSKTVEHVVRQKDGDNEISIEMDFNVFAKAVCEFVKHPAFIYRRATLEKQLLAAFESEIQKIKDSTIYR